MKKFWLLSFFSLVLSACGGSSESSSPPLPPPVSNTSPTLTGSLTLTIPANASGELIVDVNDAEGDTISVTSEELDWLSLELNAGQLTVTATPTVFELGENSVDLVLSDGTDSRTYTLTINVQDNPSSYEHRQVEPAELLGSWQISNGRELFIGAGKGFFADSATELTPFSVVFKNTSLEIQTHDFGCSSCPTNEHIEMFVIDEHNDGRVAFRLEGEETYDITILAAPIINDVLKPSAYSVVSEAVGSAFRADLSEPEVELGLSVGIQIGGSFISAIYSFELAPQTHDSGGITLSDDLVALSNRTLTQNFSVVNSVGETIDSVAIELGLQLVDVDLVYSPMGLAVFTGTTRPVLVDEANLAYPLSAYTGLQQALENNDRRQIVIYSELTPKDFPAFSAGESYLLRTVHQIATENVSDSYGKLTITGSQTATVDMQILDPLNPSIRTLDATYLVEGNSLELTVGDNTYNFSLYTNNYGRDVTVSFYAFNNLISTMSYLFVKKEDIELTPSELFGYWRSIMSSDAYSSSPAFISFADEPKMDRHLYFDASPNEEDFYRINEDGTISILRRFNCQTATDYEDCEQTILDNLLSGQLAYIEKFELFSLNTEEMILTRTEWYGGDLAGTILIGTYGRIYQKVDDSYFN